MYARLCAAIVCLGPYKTVFFFALLVTVIVNLTHRVMFSLTHRCFPTFGLAIAYFPFCKVANSSFFF